MSGRSALIRAVIEPLAALALAALAVSIILLALGTSPIDALGALLAGAFGSWLAFTETLVKACPLLFTGLAVALAFQAALWNIGADGQLLAGALLAAAIGPMLGAWPHALALILMIAAGAIGGTIWGALAGWLRAYRGVDEIIGTIMLNFIAAQLISYAIHGPLMEPSRSYPASAAIAPSAGMLMFAPPSRLNAGMILAVLLAVACWIALFRTGVGFELRAMGKNRRASAFFAIPIKRLTVWTMAASGMLAGIGGAVQISAITHRLYERLSPGWGFEAIAVALLTRLNPLGVILTALLFGALDNGAQAMQRTQGVSPVLVQIIEAMVIVIMLAFDSSLLARTRFRFWPPLIAPPIATATAKPADG